MPSKVAQDLLRLRAADAPLRRDARDRGGGVREELAARIMLKQTKIDSL